MFVLQVALVASVVKSEDFWGLNVIGISTGLPAIHQRTYERLDPPICCTCLTIDVVRAYLCHLIYNCLHYKCQMYL